MIVTKKSLGRRTVLRGMGAAIALPLLDAMVAGADRRVQDRRSARMRLGFVYVPNGFYLPQHPSRQARAGRTSSSPRS